MQLIESQNNEHHLISSKQKWIEYVLHPARFKILQHEMDEAERLNQNPFSSMNDMDMIVYFLNQQQNIDEKKNRTEETKREYARELQQFIQHILTYTEEIGIDIEKIKEGSLFKSLSKRHIRRYQEWLTQKSPHVLRKGAYSPATIARKTTIIKSFLSFLYESKYIDTPIHEGLKSATVNSDDRPNRDLGPKEVLELLDFFQKERHPILFGIIHVLVTTGLRNREFCELKVSDVKYDSILGYYYLSVLGKGNKRRSIPLKPKVMESIRTFREIRGLSTEFKADDHSPLFTTSSGKPYTPSYLSQYLTKAIERTGLPFLVQRESKINPHTFRHAFAIISYMSGADVYKIMRSLGHEKIETTMIYLEKVFEKEKHAIHEWEKGILKDYI